MAAQMILAPFRQEQILLQGCQHESMRAEMVARSLDGLRVSLPEDLQEYMMSLCELLRTAAVRLRELADRAPMHPQRAVLVSDLLNVLLPCLQRTLRDVLRFYEDVSLPKEMRWRTMYHEMLKETPGLDLAARFFLYIDFLQQLRALLTKSTEFEMNTLARLQAKILEMREARNIALPSSENSIARLNNMMLMQLEPNQHWAQQIFSIPLSSRTPFGRPIRKQQRASACLGPHHPVADLKLPPGSKVLFRRPFDRGTLNLTAYSHDDNESSSFVMEHTHMNASWYSRYGVHELCVKRGEASNALVLKRWDSVHNTPTKWSFLNFQTWEEMVLFHCTFLSLKARNTRTIKVDPEEYKLRGEERLFQAKIRDDKYIHSLVVYKDAYTKGIRLHAMVWEGELKQSPVWTAFVTHQSASRKWLQRKGKHTVWLRDVQLYVFCHRYNPQHQRRNTEGAFEIKFINDKAAREFKEVFYPAAEPGSSTESSEGSEKMPSPSD